MIIKECKHCGKKFSSYKKQNRKFCCKQCYFNSDYLKKLTSEKITGRKHTDLEKKKMSDKTKGKKHPNFGKHLSVETKKKISNSRKIRKKLLGFLNSAKTREKISHSLIGNVPWNKGKGITTKEQRLRLSKAYAKWRKEVLKRDNYTCQKCGCRGGEIIAHHVKSFSKFPFLRLEISNGQTLCKKCHKKTNNFGWNIYNMKEKI